jgi:hypothetical protein
VQHDLAALVQKYSEYRSGQEDRGVVERRIPVQLERDLTPAGQQEARYAVQAQKEAVRSDFPGGPGCRAPARAAGTASCRIVTSGGPFSGAGIRPGSSTWLATSRPDTRYRCEGVLSIAAFHPADEQAQMHGTIERVAIFERACLGAAGV